MIDGMKGEGSSCDDGDGVSSDMCARRVFQSMIVDQAQGQNYRVGG